MRFDITAGHNRLIVLPGIAEKPNPASHPGLGRSLKLCGPSVTEDDVGGRIASGLPTNRELVTPWQLALQLRLPSGSHMSVERNEPQVPKSFEVCLLGIASFAGTDAPIEESALHWAAR